MRGLVAQRRKSKVPARIDAGGFLARERRKSVLLIAAEALQIRFDPRPGLLEVVVAKLSVELLHHFERSLHQLVVAHVDQLTAGNALFLFKVVAHHRFVEMQHGFIELGVGDALKR